VSGLSRSDAKPIIPYLICLRSSVDLLRVSNQAVRDTERLYAPGMTDNGGETPDRWRPFFAVQ